MSILLSTSLYTFFLYIPILICCFVYSAFLRINNFYIHTYCTFVQTYWCSYPSICLSIYISIYLSIYLYIYLSIQVYGCTQTAVPTVTPRAGPATSGRRAPTRASPAPSTTCPTCPTSGDGATTPARLVGQLLLIISELVIHSSNQYCITLWHITSAPIGAYGKWNLK